MKGDCSCGVKVDTAVLQVSKHQDIQAVLNAGRDPHGTWTAGPEKEDDVPLQTGGGFHSGSRSVSFRG